MTITKSVQPIGDRPIWNGLRGYLTAGNFDDMLYFVDDCQQLVITKARFFWHIEAFYYQYEPLEGRYLSLHDAVRGIKRFESECMNHD